MSGTDVVWFMLTVLFAAAALQELRRRVLPRGSGWRTRIDGLLHTVMALAMCAMPWSRGARVPAGAAAVFFAAAALWFVLPAPGRRRGTRLGTAARDLPSAAGMAAMAWTARPAASSGHGVLAAHAGHASGEAAPHDTGVGVLAFLLALYLLGCALRALTRDLPGLRRTTAHPKPPALGQVYGHFWEGATSLGTAVMLLMHQG